MRHARRTPVTLACRRVLRRVGRPLAARALRQQLREGAARLRNPLHSFNACSKPSSAARLVAAVSRSRQSRNMAFPLVGDAPGTARLGSVLGRGCRDRVPTGARVLRVFRSGGGRAHGCHARQAKGRQWAGPRVLRAARRQRRASAQGTGAQHQVRDTRASQQLPVQRRGSITISTTRGLLPEKSWHMATYRPVQIRSNNCFTVGTKPLP